MKFLEDITLGRFEPGDSPLHRLDPRLKLVGLPLLIIATFSWGGPDRMAALAVLAVGLLALSGIDWRIWWRGIRVFRWLLLFTLVLHLLFSPGRTLLGVSWLSRDGLMHGLAVCGQLVLAVLFSSALTLTTAPGEVAAATVALLRPLRRIGFPVQKVGELFFLVLHFIPILREEAREVVSEAAGKGLDPSRGPLLLRGRILGGMIEPLVLRLVDRADSLAGRMAAGEPVVEMVRLKPFLAGGPFYWIALPAGAGLMLLLFSL